MNETDQGALWTDPNRPPRVLVCGSRDWTAQGPIYRELRQLPPGTVVIHGDCRGADRIADHCARLLGFEVQPMAADWEYWRTRGRARAAGPVRNERMFREGRPDLVLAFHAEYEFARGTRDVIERAKRHGVPWRLFER